MIEKNSAEIQKKVCDLNSTISIIMLSLDTSYLRAEQATERGAVVLQRPVHATALIQTIDSLII